MEQAPKAFEFFYGRLEKDDTEASLRDGLEWLESYLAQEGVTDPDLWQALRRKKWRYQHPKLHRLFSWSRRPASRAIGLTKRTADRLIAKPVRTPEEKRRADDK